MDHILDQANIIVNILAGSLIGAYIGTHFATKLNEQLLTQIGAIFLVLLSFLLIGYNIIEGLHSLQIPPSCVFSWGLASESLSAYSAVCLESRAVNSLSQLSFLLISALRLVREHRQNTSRIQNNVQDVG